MRWSESEDALLLRLKAELIGPDGETDWHAVAKRIPGRNAKQARERYHSALDPKLNRAPWSEEEIQKLYKLIDEHGTQWAKIAEELGTNRSELNIRNVYYSRQRKEERSQIRSRAANPNRALEDEVLGVSRTTRLRTRRSAESEGSDGRAQGGLGLGLEPMMGDEGGWEAEDEDGDDVDSVAAAGGPMEHNAPRFLGRPGSARRRPSQLLSGAGGPISGHSHTKRSRTTDGGESYDYASDGSESSKRARSSRPDTRSSFRDDDGAYGVRRPLGGATGPAFSAFPGPQGLGAASGYGSGPSFQGGPVDRGPGGPSGVPSTGAGAGSSGSSAAGAASSSLGYGAVEFNDGNVARGSFRRSEQSFIPSVAVATGTRRGAAQGQGQPQGLGLVPGAARGAGGVSSSSSGAVGPFSYQFGASSAAVPSFHGRGQPGGAVGPGSGSDEEDGAVRHRDAHVSHAALAGRGRSGGPGAGGIWPAASNGAAGLIGIDVQVGPARPGTGPSPAGTSALRAQMAGLQVSENCVAKGVSPHLQVPFSTPQSWAPVGKDNWPATGQRPPSAEVRELARMAATAKVGPPPAAPAGEAVMSVGKTTNSNNSAMQGLPVSVGYAGTVSYPGPGAGAVAASVAYAGPSFMASTSAAPPMLQRQNSAGALKRPGFVTGLLQELSPADALATPSLRVDDVNVLGAAPGTTLPLGGPWAVPGQSPTMAQGPLIGGSQAVGAGPMGNFPIRGLASNGEMDTGLASARVLPPGGLVGGSGLVTGQGLHGLGSDGMIIDTPAAFLAGGPQLGMRSGLTPSAASALTAAAGVEFHHQLRAQMAASGRPDAVLAGGFGSGLTPRSTGARGTGIYDMWDPTDPLSPALMDLGFSEAAGQANGTGAGASSQSGRPAAKGGYGSGLASSGRPAAPVLGAPAGIGSGIGAGIGSGAVQVGVTGLDSGRSARSARSGASVPADDEHADWGTGGSSKTGRNYAASRAGSSSSVGSPHSKVSPASGSHGASGSTPASGAHVSAVQGVLNNMATYNHAMANGLNGSSQGSMAQSRGAGQASGPLLDPGSAPAGAFDATSGLAFLSPSGLLGGGPFTPGMMAFMSGTSGR